METLKDIKEVLSKIPDKELEKFFFGCGEDAEDTISLVCMTDEDDEEKDYHAMWEKYPELKKLGNLIENIKKAQEILDKQDSEVESLQEHLQEEGITDTFFDKKKTD